MLEQIIISVQIILIDIVMAADNAIIIGLIAANFAPDNRKKIIAWGVAAAFVFRIIFAFFADFMFVLEVYLINVIVVRCTVTPHLLIFCSYFLYV